MGTLMFSSTSAAPSSTTTSTIATDTGTTATSATPTTTTPTPTTTTAIITEPTTSRAASGGSERSDSKPLIVGVSTGVGLGVCLVTLIGALCLQRRRYQRRLNENQYFGVTYMSSGGIHTRPAAAPAELPSNQAPRVFEMGTGG
ncbi:hypothetical protein KXV92_001223 [Aspergillus fumigatus]|nr:hypothetical protein KXX32_000148 [Aspergillus fumigatus]KAH1500598.1 hypothetical protein KXX42_000075 [Aspergillus fumigatus]KAH1554304.1 hypothetical protein KXX57_005837 [Aspergillus fumigatus]KAH1981150.1 hypothetical protein KXW88_006165 [Aspergillus fumigatus]KAH2314547.1 hypothetical protein KXV47_002377 [Aspergillus fumigatus]